MFKTAISTIFLLFCGSFVFLVPITATGFSGSDKNNYTCPDVFINGQLETVDNINFEFYCEGYSDGQLRRAILKPPQLIQLQFLFVKVVYTAWGLAGIFFTLVLGFLGFLWMTSQGDEKKIGDVKKRITKWFIGFALIFLSYPALNTFFNILPLRQGTCYSELNMIGFQFFFNDVCREPLPTGCSCLEGDETAACSNPNAGKQQDTTGRCSSGSMCCVYVSN